MLRVKSTNVLIILSFFISILTGYRLSHVGKDTEAYQNHFYNSSIVDGLYDRFEIGFALLMQFFSKAMLSVELFFTFVALIVTLTYTHSFKKIYSKCFRDRNPNKSVLVVYFSLLLISSWYYSATTNGLRQGLSLVFLYWASVELFYFDKKLKFIGLLGIAITFHYSAILIAPFLLLHSIRFRYVFIVWALLAYGYMIGLNEIAVKAISNSLNLPIYEYIKYYSLEKGLEERGGGLYEGFILSFFLYTVFWPALLLLVVKIKLSYKNPIAERNNIYTLLKIYFFLSLIYFVLGFGPFSNRYAFFSWFLIPIIQIVTISLAFNLSSIRLLPLLAFFLAVVYFLYFRLDWISFFIY